MTFLDTNVLVYAVDKLDAAKQARPLAVVTEAISTPGFMVSAQVLNEFSNVALLKLKLTTGEVRQFVNVFNRMKVVPVDPKWTDRALTIKSQYGTQFFNISPAAQSRLMRRKGIGIGAHACASFGSPDGNVTCEASHPTSGA